MEVTPELIVRLRENTAERIPAGSADVDTNFTDDQLTVILEENDSLEMASYRVWILKMGWALEGRNIAIEKTVGSERLKLLSPKEQAEHAKMMADFYFSQVTTEDSVPTGAFMGEMEPDDVLGVKTTTTYEDLSRLLPRG